MNSKHHILVIYSLRSSFVKQDLDALKSNYNVTEYQFGIQKGFDQITAQFRLLFFLMRNASKYLAVYSWFADYHSLFPAILTRLYKFKFIVAIGGFDAAKVKELNYGVHVNFFRSQIVKFVIRKANFIIFSSRFTLYELLKNTKLFIDQNKYKIVYPGINPISRVGEQKSASYLMIYVAAGDSINRMGIKGVDRFLELARTLNEFQFLLIGPTGMAYEWVLKKKSENVNLLPSVERTELYQYYNESTFVALFSRFEAFGMVLLEGISSGCKPITLSNIGSEEIVNQCGNFGKVFKTFDIHEISKYLKSNANSKIEPAEVQSFLHRFQEGKRAEAISNFLRQG